MPSKMDLRARNVSELTGWDLNTVRKKMNYTPVSTGSDSKWWKKIWK